ncbi:MAG TPA: amino acid permease [Longimicrobium sp.]|nr:amino acid permease [Longimicrobium sp.]
MQEQATAASEARLIRAMGVWALAAGIVNVTIGGGIFRLPSAAATQLGTAAPLAYLVCAVAMGLIVLCFAEAGSRVDLTGGPYAYVEVAFGQFVGFLAGVLLWLTGTLALSAVTTLFADSVGALVPAFSGAAARIILIVAALGLYAAINVAGIRQGSTVNAVATVAKLLPLLLLVLVGAFAVRAGNLAMGDAPALGDVARASAVLIFAFAGIESALVPSGEVKDVARTVPRAILLAMAGVTLLYIAIHLVAQGVLGGALAGHPTPLAEAAGQALGPTGRALLLAGASISMFGYIGGMTLAVPRALFALGRDGFLPRALASVHARHRTPHVAIWTQAAITAALALTSGFERLAILANLAILLLYGACCLAAWELRRRGVQAGGIPFRVPGGAVIPFLALGAIAYLLTSIKPDEWLMAGAVLAISAILYFVTRGARAASPAVR